MGAFNITEKYNLHCTSPWSSSSLLFFAVWPLPTTTKSSEEPLLQTMLHHSSPTSREVVPSCVEVPLSLQDTSSPLPTANTTSHPVLQSPSEMSPSPELKPANKPSTPSDKSPSQSSPTTTAIPTHTTEDKSTQA